MTREEAKELLPIIKAYAEGKTIQFQNTFGAWIDIPNNGKVCFDEGLTEFRIKSEPKYRPFKSQEECWNEMHKHPDFGWVRYKGHFLNICEIGTDFLTICPDEHTETWDLSKCISEMTFTDDTPFGIKEE